MPANLYGSNDNYDQFRVTCWPHSEKAHKAKVAGKDKLDVWGTEPGMGACKGTHLADACCHG